MAETSDTLTQWPVGGGVTGDLIRAHDWASTPLGPTSAWPASLRGAIDAMLGSAFPTFVWWGEALIQVYNDAAAATIDPRRHAATFAVPACEAWSDVWESISPVADQILATGKAVLGEDLAITPYRGGEPTPAWFTFSYSPLHHDDGGGAGLFIIAIETTARVLAETRLRESEARQSFLLRLSDTIRQLPDPAEITARAGELLGAELGVGRCGYGEVDETGAFFTVHEDWTDGRMASLAGRIRLDDFGPEMIAEFRAGRTVRLDDPLKDARTRSSADAFESIGQMRGGVAVPLLKEGRFVAALYAHQTEPRRWTDDEVALIQEVAERTWDAVERGRAETALRHSEARYRSLFESIDEGFCVVEFIEDDHGRLTDFAYVEANPALAIRSGITGVLNRRISELLPGEAREWIAILGKVLRSGESLRFQRTLAATDRLLELFAFRVENASHQVGILFQDITEQRRNEEHMRLMVNELNHRVKNNLAMIQAIATQSFRNADSLGDAQERFTARIMAMARANDLLTGERWAGASLRNAIDQVVRSHCPDPGRCVASGPEARLTPKTALALSLALHELAVNALKYGAWSTDRGRILISWSTEQAADGGEHLSFEWRERDGPPVSPPKRRGFGSRLIERGLAAEMGGAVTLRFEPDGLVCAFDAALAAQDPDETQIAAAN